MPDKFRLLNNSKLQPEAKKGSFVYKFAGYDYGLASDDTRAFEEPHISVTLNEDGSIPSFTIPEKDLELIVKEEVKANFYKCGAGRKSECCAYLLGGPKGAECGREQTIKTHIENRVAARDMVSRRLPTEPFPECMKFPEALTPFAPEDEKRGD